MSGPRWTGRPGRCRLGSARLARSRSSAASGMVAYGSVPGCGFSTREDFPCSTSRPSRPPCANSASTAGCCTTSAGATCWPGASSGWTGSRTTSRRFYLLRPGRRRADQAGPPHRDRRARPPAGREGRLPPLAGAGGRRRIARGRKTPRGDGVFAPERQPVHLPGRRRDGRTGPVVRRRGRLVGRPDPAVRGDLGRRAVGDAPRGRAHTTAAYDVAWGFIADRVQAAGGDVGDEVQAAIMDHFRKQRPDDLQPADRRRWARTAATRTSRRPGSATRRSARGDFVLIDLWAKLDRPRAVYSDLTRVGVRRHDRAGRVRGDLRRSWRRPATRRSPG